MSALDANFCPDCGSPVETAVAIHTDDVLPAEAVGSFERSGAHAQIAEREVRVYVHEESERNG